MNNQSKQKQAGVGEGSEKKSQADGEVAFPVDEPVVEEGPVEPEAQEVRLLVLTVSGLGSFLFCAVQCACIPVEIRYPICIVAHIFSKYYVPNSRYY